MMYAFFNDGFIGYYISKVTFSSVGAQIQSLGKYVSSCVARLILDIFLLSNIIGIKIKIPSYITVILATFSWTKMADDDSPWRHFRPTYQSPIYFGLKVTGVQKS